MSSPLAIAAVSAVLKDLLDNGLVDASLSSGTNAPVKVTLIAPNRIKTDSSENSQINLYLYQVTANSGWRNADLPSRNSDGYRLTNPPLALDLHYLLTAYGANDFDSEILLGYAMQMLHETPVLLRDSIRKTLDSASPLANLLPPAFSALSADDLADQIEMVKITPEFLGTEEMSKLWTAMQIGYHTSVCYRASVVLIQSRRPTRPTLPVRNRNLFVLPFRQPAINSVSPQIITTGGTLTVLGVNLKDQNLKLNFSGVAADPQFLADARIDVVIPPGLQPGVNTVQVVHPLNFGTNQEPHDGFQSNAAAFMLAPEITLPASVARGSTLIVSVSPPVGRAQNVALLVGSQTLPIPARSASGPDVTSTLDFPIPANFPAGAFLVRVQIDGAQSQLTVDPNPASPTFNQYNSPILNLT
jgi:Pvc16 N-terminal domain/IPT/TIG domain